MYKGRSVLAVVPARGGSKGVPLKNLHPLMGRPLVAHVGDIVRGAGLFDRAVVSTDHDGIAAAAEKCGLSAPFRRPPDLSGDRVGDWEVLHHALVEVERLDRTSYDVVVMLQPTSPLRTSGQVVAAVARLIDGDWDAVWTVSPVPLKYHPLKQLALDDGGRLRLFDARGREVIARQQLTPLFYRNGAAYALSRRAVVELRTTLPERSSAVVIDDELISIDTASDVADVERRLEAAGRVGHDAC